MSELSEKRYLKRGGPVLVVFYNKLSWFDFIRELLENDPNSIHEPKGKEAY